MGNTEIIAAASSLATVVIWMVYLHLFWTDFRRRSRPSLIIHHATGQSPQATCLFVNMSKEPVHVQCIIARVSGPQGDTTHYLTEYSRFSPEDGAVQARLREGPIQAGGYLVLGTFEDIILGRDVGLEQDGSGMGEDMLDAEKLMDVQRLEICVAVTHGQIDRPIGARRTFFVEERDGAVGIHAYNIHTEQMLRGSRRREVRRWVESRIEPRLREEPNVADGD